MPYTTNADLPQNVAEHLPEQAQSIYRKAFNNALKEYDDETTAFRVAWAAVKKQYEKDENGKWIKKEE